MAAPMLFLSTSTTCPWTLSLTTCADLQRCALHELCSDGLQAGNGVQQRTPVSKLCRQHGIHRRRSMRLRAEQTPMRRSTPIAVARISSRASSSMLAQLSAAAHQQLHLPTSTRLPQRHFGQQPCMHASLPADPAASPAQAVHPLCGTHIVRSCARLDQAPSSSTCARPARYRCLGRCQHDCAASEPPARQQELCWAPRRLRP
jgi:hypothetical protein